MATSTKTKLYKTTSARLPELPVTAGNIIFTTDTQVLYMDTDSMRIPYSIQLYEDEDSRLADSSPLMGYYYVLSSNIMWYYSSTGSWKQMTPSNIKPIIYADNETEFPSEGDNNTLYSTYDAVYRWDTREQTYTIIANKTAWKIM